MTKPIEVLITGPLLNSPGGVSHYYSAVLPHLQIESGFNFRYLEIGARRNTGGLRRIVNDQVRVFRALVQYNPQIVHINPSLNYKSFLRDAMFAVLAKQKRRRLLVFFRGWDDGVAYEIESRLRWLFRTTLGRADRFIVLSEAIGEQLRQWGVQAHIDRGTTVVPDELLEGFSIDKKIASLQDQDTIKVLFMARIEKSKGAMETIDAVMQLAKAGVAISLTIAGDGAEMNAVEKRIEDEVDARSHISLAGYVSGDTKRELLRTHHIYCLPSYHAEGMPNALLEAMAFGMPIVTCAVGGINDMFVEDDMGFLVPPRDSNAIAQGIGKLISSPETMARIAALNHQYATKNALASEAAKFLVESYRALL